MQPGQVIAGKFRIEQILGSGGMGVVAVATHIPLAQPVALKFLHDDIARDPLLVARLIREARAIAQLRSEHVCRVMDVGQLASGAPYIVMELLAGRDLGKVIAGQRLWPAMAAELVLQACIAVAEAHAIGIIHRDLKPSNLFLTERLDGSPLIKVLDFGIAKAPVAPAAQLTRTEAVMGSPGYMSPEQLRSARDVDARSDIWSLGVVLYEAVAGHLPFRAASLTEMALKIAMDPHEPIETTPLCAQVIARCLDKLPERRYQTIAELAADLAIIAGPRGANSAAMIARMPRASSPAVDVPFATVSQGAPSYGPPAMPPPLAIAPPPQPSPPVAPTVQLQPAPGGPRSPARRLRRWLIASLAVAAAVVAVSLAVTAAHDIGPPTAATAAAPTASVRPPDTAAGAAKPVEPARSRAAGSGSAGSGDSIFEDHVCHVSSDVDVGISVVDRRGRASDAALWFRPGDEPQVRIDDPEVADQPVRLLVAIEGTAAYLDVDPRDFSDFASGLARFRARPGPVTAAAVFTLTRTAHLRFEGELAAMPANVLGRPGDYRGATGFDLPASLRGVLDYAQRSAFAGLTLLVVIDSRVSVPSVAVAALRAEVRAAHVELRYIELDDEATRTTPLALASSSDAAAAARDPRQFDRAIDDIIERYRAARLLTFRVPGAAWHRASHAAIEIDGAKHDLVIDGDTASELVE